MARHVQHSAHFGSRSPTETRSNLFAAAAAASFLTLSTLSVHADAPPAVPDRLELPMSAAQSCASTSAASDSELSTARDCVMDSAFSALIGATLEFANRRGEELFGEQFHIDSRMSFASSRGRLNGDLDAIIPLNSFASTSANRDSRALFMQNGLTRWTDPHGLERTDVRYGLVHRFAVSGQPDAGVVGVSVFFQENLERGHQRVVTGVDYANRWGTSSLSYFMPTTDWRPGRSGYEERALEGAEFRFRKDATRTISLDAAAGQWESEVGSADWVTRGRLGIAWKPHPWLGIRGSWDDIGSVDDSLGVQAVVAIPFGGGDPSQPRWRGLGLAGSEPEEDEESGPSVHVWRSVDNVGPLRIAERSQQAPDGPDFQAGSTEPNSSGTVLIVMSGSFGGN